MVKEIKCRHKKDYEDWICVDDEGNRYKLIDENTYDGLDSMMDSLGAVVDVGGVMDRYTVAKMYSKFQHTPYFWNQHPEDYAYECMEEFKGTGEKIPASYCWMKGLEDAGKEAIESIADEELNEKEVNEDAKEEFIDWLKENLDDTEMYYNYTDWGCQSEPEEGFCELVENAMNSNLDKVKERINSLFRKWLEEEGEEYKDELMKVILEEE